MTSRKRQGGRRRTDLARRRLRITIGDLRFYKTGLPANRIDLYHLLVSISWPRFYLAFLATEVVINSLFAGLYLLDPGGIGNQAPKGFFGAFFFSMETLATVGYGQMYPASMFTHVVSSLEIAGGVALTAVVTGLVFARFTRQKPRLAYADKAVLSVSRGHPTLMFRFCNVGVEVLHNARITLYVLIETSGHEGRVLPIELKLTRSTLSIFTAAWLVRHVIDETSPLHPFATPEAVGRLRFFQMFSAQDPEIGKEVTDLHSFSGADVVFGVRYVEIETSVENGIPIVDFSALSEVEPDRHAREAAATA